MIIPSSRRSKTEVSPWATHAVVASPPLPASNSILSLWPIDGRLYLGHGEWTKNLGPTDVISVGPDGDVISHLADAPTEAFNVFREIDGWIYAPLTDPRGFSQGGYATNEGGVWHVVKTDLQMTHTFDITKTSHGLWLTGSSNPPGDGTEPCVYLSSDGGATWTQVLSEPSASLGRFYGIWAEGDTVFVKGSPSGSSTKASSDGGQSWAVADRPDLDTALSPGGYRQPDWYNTPRPDAYDLKMREWSVLIDMPAGASRPVVMDGTAYCVAQTGTSVTIYRRPAPLDDVNT